ncbi:MAG: hypothetical protein EKK63_09120 [Acinetobacter sp.]|uniref:hypothetical protein n=1 Tax=Acinetobacter sp. TaxID=472 RepID=UPI000FC2ADFA|nr:hypothetical protein [Acinetobacter sp.]RUP39788.1 MAG: hypothetical protein EKK63_09120 [Acinetobacter sp.]
MNTKYKNTPVKVAKPIPEPDGFIRASEIEKLFKNHCKTVIAIVQDYIGGAGMEQEIDLAHQNFAELIGDAKYEGSDFKIAFRILENLRSADIDDVKILDLLDEDKVKDWLENKGYRVFKKVPGGKTEIAVWVEGLDKVNKLKAFIETEIHPLYNDQDKFIFEN